MQKYLDQDNSEFKEIAFWMNDNIKSTEIHILELEHNEKNDNILLKSLTRTFITCIVETRSLENRESMERLLKLYPGRIGIVNCKSNNVKTLFEDQRFDIAIINKEEYIHQDLSLIKSMNIPYLIIPNLNNEKENAIEKFKMDNYLQSFLRIGNTELFSLDKSNVFNIQQKEELTDYNKDKDEDVKMKDDNYELDNKDKDNIEPDQHVDYIFYPQMDSPENDLCRLKDASIEKLKEYCNKNQDCRGFNTNGYVKYHIVEKDKMTYLNQLEKTEGLYVKNLV